MKKYRRKFYIAETCRRIPSVDQKNVYILPNKMRELKEAARMPVSEFSEKYLGIKFSPLQKKVLDKMEGYQARKE